MPLPNTRVIPVGWEAAHAPVAEQAMTATATVTRPASNGPPVFDEETGRSQHPAPSTVHSGPCRIQRSALTGGHAPVVADKVTPLREYVTSWPLDAPVFRVNDLVTVTDATDTELAGQVLRIVDVRRGSLVWQRDYLAEEHVPTTR